MQYKIPQDVQRPDTIIGPVTFKQLAILLLGGGISYAIYLSLANTYFWYVWIWPVGFFAIMTIAIAFLKIGDMTFITFILYLVEFLFKPRNRAWQKGDNEFTQSILKPFETAEKEPLEINAEDEKLQKKKKLEELTKSLDQ